MDEDLEDIRKLNELIKAENEKDCDYIPNEFLTSDSSEDEDESDDDDYEELFVEEQIEVDSSDINLKYAQPVDSELSKYLPCEELEIINNCKDSTLKQLLILNRTKKLQLQKLNHKYCFIISKTAKLLKKSLQLDMYKRMLDGHKGFRTKLGYPYFKEKVIPVSYAPLNEDAIKKNQNKEVNFNLIKTGKLWNQYSHINLKAEVMMSYLENKLQKYEGDLRLAKYNSDEELEGKINENIQTLKDDFDTLEAPPLWDDTFLSWSKIANKQFKDINLYQVCRAYWNLYVHPEINKTSLNNSEATRLTDICSKHDFVDWEKIADEFGNHRSPYWLACYFFSTLNIKVQQRKIRFSEFEDSYLLSIVESQRVGRSIAWNRVADLIKSRNKNQLYRRYIYKLKDNPVKVGSFSESEDIMIMCLYKTHGPDFDLIARHLPHRSKEQIQQRYRNYLKHDHLNFSKWTIQDDNMILEHVEKCGVKGWLAVAKKINRTDSHVRHRYRVLKKYLDKNVPIEEIPRKSYNIARNRALTQQAVDYYLTMKTLPTVNEKEHNAIGRPSRNFIDNELINFFRTTSGVRKARKLQSITNEKLNNCTNSIHSVLQILGANLNIPDNLETEDSLTLLDRDILTNLREKCIHYQLTANALVPPNINTVQACRVLLLKYRNKQPSAPSQCLSNESIKFQRRFKSLFYWPCLMSIIMPPKTVLEKQEVKPAVIKPVGRPRKNLDKINKMAEMKRKKSGLLTATKNNSMPSFKVMPVLESSKINGNPKIVHVETVIENIQRASKESKGNYLIKIDKSMVQKLIHKQNQTIIQLKRKTDDEQLDDRIDNKKIKTEINIEPGGPSTSGTKI